VTDAATDPGEGWVHPVVGGCLFLAGPLGWLLLLIRFIRYQGGKRFHTRQWEKVVAGIVGTLLALAWLSSLTRGFTGTTGSTGYGDLRVGDCFDIPAAEAAKVATGQTASVTGVQRRTCTTPHHGEIVFTDDVAGATYPGEDAFAALFKERCVPAYRSYTGRDFDADTVYDMTYIYPLPEGWAKQADRRFVCFATRVDGKPESRSIKP
jgi:hypothetical protein